MPVRKLFLEYMHNKIEFVLKSVNRIKHKFYGEVVCMGENEIHTNKVQRPGHQEKKTSKGSLSNIKQGYTNNPAKTNQFLAKMA